MAACRSMVRTLVMHVLIFTAAAPASAMVRHVPGDYPTIQVAINASTLGDEMLVDPSTYVEHTVLACLEADGICRLTIIGSHPVKRAGSGRPQ